MKEYISLHESNITTIFAADRWKEEEVKCFFTQTTAELTETQAVRGKHYYNRSMHIKELRWTGELSRV